MSTAHPHSPRFYCILVHHGPVAPTASAVAALLGGKRVPHQVIIINHDEQPLPRTGPFAAASVLTIHPETNSGYGAGFNLGLGVLYSQGAKAHDLVIGLNNDVTVHNDTVAQLQQWWQANPEPALVGVRVHEGERQVVGGSLNRRTGRTHLIDQSALHKPTPPPLDYIHGAFFVVPYEICLHTKGMPEQYFLYWEDVAFSDRVKRLGYPLKSADGISVEHHHLDPPTPTQTYYLVRNGAHFMATTGRLPQRAWWRMYNRLRYLFHFLTKGQNNVVTQALRDAGKKTTGKYAPTESA